MKKINISPLSGTEDRDPTTQAVFNTMKSKISQIYKAHGFFPIETPTLERLEVLTAKAGGDTEKQIYSVTKTSESVKNPSEGLRFDHTIPLARYVAAHESTLDFPLKAQQIGLNFRGERAQKGRFREFYQCDIDVIGRSKLDLAYDADVISTLLDVFASFDLSTPVLARISNRKILSGLLEALDLKEKTSEISNIIDHAEKVTPEQTEESLAELKLDKSGIKTILDFISLNGPRSEVITALNNLEIENSTLAKGIDELDRTLGLLESMGLTDQITADLKIIRGLDYYTGTVFEFILPEYKNLGSVCGGGRYENLTKYFSDRAFPGVGGSIGLTRLFYVLNENNLLNSSIQSLLDFCIIPISDAEVDYAFEVAAKLRESGKSTTVAITDKKLSERLAYASKVAGGGIVIGEEELNSGRLLAKDFDTGDTLEISFSKEKPSVQPEDFWHSEGSASDFL